MTLDLKTFDRLFLTSLKITFLFSIFHSRFGAFVVGAGAAFGLAGGGDFGDDFVEVGGGGADGAGAGGIADGAESNNFSGDGFVFLRFEELGDSEEAAVAFEDFAFVGEVDGWERDFLTFDVHPDVHFGEVGEREDTEVFAGIFAAVEEVPEFGALVFWIPLAEVVAVGEEAFFGAGFFLVAASATEAGIVLMFLDGIEEGDGLELIAGGVGAGFLDDAAGIDGFLDGTDDESGAEEFHEFIAIDHGFIEVVASIDMDEWEGRTSGPESFFRKPCHDDGVFTAREEEGGVFELGGGLAEDEDRLGFELVELGQIVIHEFFREEVHRGGAEVAEGRRAGLLEKDG